MIKAPLHKIIPFSSVDGPGNRIAIFFQECNFNCKYCHNPETINRCNSCGKCVIHCPTQALYKEKTGEVQWNSKVCCNCEKCIQVCPRTSCPRTEWVTPEELVKRIEKYFPFVDGVTVSGGECTLHHEFLAAFLGQVKKQGKTTFVDTNGSLEFRKMPELVKVMDYAMIDVKSTQEEEHQILTGKSCVQVLENVQYLASRNKLFEIRTVIIPEVLENEKTVEKASQIIGAYKNIRYKLIKYRQQGVREDVLIAKEPSLEYMNKLKKIAHHNKVEEIIII